MSLVDVFEQDAEREGVRSTVPLQRIEERQTSRPRIGIDTPLGQFFLQKRRPLFGQTRLLLSRHGRRGGGGVGGVSWYMGKLG